MSLLASQLNIQSATLRYNKAESAVYSDLQLQLKIEGWTCLLGPSGCGKSSLLRQLAGLIEPEHQSTMVLAQGRVTDVKDQVAWMGQQDLLFPWLSVLDNVCLPQRVASRGLASKGFAFGRVTKDYRQHALSLLHSLGLKGWDAHRPHALSGGMRQRVALARTLIQDKPLVLMDEPFSALDAVSRYELQNLAAKKLSGRTVLLVTHDPQEALRLGHRIVCFSDKPSRLQELPCPPMQPPRALNDLGSAQQQLLDALGVAA